MDTDLKQEFDWLNANLNPVVKNQAEIYCKLRNVFM